MYKDPVSRPQNNRVCGARGLLRMPDDIKAAHENKTPEEIRALEKEVWPQAVMEKYAGLVKTFYD